MKENDIFKELVIFEMANNHQGDVELGKKIVREMGKLSAKYNIKSAVKLQYRDLDSFIHPDFKGRKDIAHIPRFEGTRLNILQFNELINCIKKEGMIAMCTPFDEMGVEWCMDQEVDIIKIASCSSMDWPLLEKVAMANQPIIISTGGKRISDIDKIYNFFIHRKCKFALLHCVAEYPAPIKQIQLDFLDLMKRRYPDIHIGYSGHESPRDIMVQIMAVAKGAEILERHVGIETDTIQLNEYSLNPNEVEKWLKAIVAARDACTLKKNGDKYISQAEQDSLQSLQRGVFVKKDIEQGNHIMKEDVFFAMPRTDKQMCSGDMYDGVIASQNYSQNAPIFETRPVTEVTYIRQAIHEAKGLLSEAGIVVGKDVEMELSHHYGKKSIKSTGCVILNVINREYCKKLIVVLKGQRHPTHFHKIKEETFQVLYGDLECIVNGVNNRMEPGDIQTILRGDEHSFYSKNGAIFEEISTTHIKGDSYYKDERIMKIDYMERKTIVREW